MVVIGCNWLLLASLGVLVAVAIGDQAPAQHAENAEQMEATADLTDEDKRAWQSLHGGWGKRAWQSLHGGWGKRAWQNMASAWGKRAWQDLNGGWGKRGWNDMSAAWGKRARDNAGDQSKWQSFHGSWGKRAPSEVFDYWQSEMPVDKDVYDSNTADQYGPMRQVFGENADKLMEAAEEMEPSDKRAWSSLHGTWGKRSSPRGMNNGFYLKREPAWTNLRGMWGKRSTNWNRLDKVWGKRENVYDYPDRRDE